MNPFESFCTTLFANRKRIYAGKTLIMHCVIMSLGTLTRWGSQVQILYGPPFCILHATERSSIINARNADMAQLVEHHLAKVGVAGSNPVVRSTKMMGPAAGRPLSLKRDHGDVAKW